jgi:hypothetical protein
MKVKSTVDHWVQLYLQAKASGDSKMAKLYESIIIKLGGKVPKL